MTEEVKEKTTKKSTYKKHYNNRKSFSKKTEENQKVEKPQQVKNVPQEKVEMKKEVVRKARNCHSKHTAKNFDEETYKKATAFEALVGYLYLNKQTERLNYVLENSMKEE